VSPSLTSILYFAGTGKERRMGPESLIGKKLPTFYQNGACLVVEEIVGNFYLAVILV